VTIHTRSALGLPVASLIAFLIIASIATVNASSIDSKSRIVLLDGGVFAELLGMLALAAAPAFMAVAMSVTKGDDSKSVELSGFDVAVEKLDSYISAWNK
jgi:hypothetical protein